MTPPTLECALEYVGRGWHVFPLKPRSKRPATEHGFKNATCDVAQVRQWFGGRVPYNVGIATGAASGVFVLDVDPRNGGDETLGALETKFGKLPETPRVLTGGGGQHFFFRCPPGVSLRGTLGDGLDSKNGGGYVAAPPSIHPDTGLEYRWDLGALPRETLLADAPDWMMEALTAPAPNAPLSAIPGSDARDTVLGAAFEEAGMLRASKPSGIRLVVCPWAHEHTDGRGDGKDDSTVIMPPTTQRRWGAFSCRHGHCSDRKFSEVVARLPRAAVVSAYVKHGLTPPPVAHDPETGEVKDDGTSSESGTDERSTSGPFSIGDLFTRREESGPVVHEPTGLLELDRFTRGGPTYGSTSFVIGAPDASKTLLLWAIAVAYARRGILVGFHAIDEEPTDLLTRLVQMTHDPTSGRHYSRERFETAAADSLGAMRAAVGDLPIVVYDDRWTIERAADDLARRANGKRASFFMDSLQTASCDAVRDAIREVDSRRAVTENSRAVRQAAIRHGLITMATSESNREWTKAREDGRNASAMTAGAESRAVEFRARVVLALSPCAHDDDLIQVDIPKNKLGRKAEPGFWLRIDRETQTLTDAQKPEATSRSGPSDRQRNHREAVEEQTRRTADRKRQATEQRAEEAQRKKDAAVDLDRRTATEVLKEQPGIGARAFRAEMRARCHAGSDRADAARVWVERRPHTDEACRDVP